MTIVPEQWVFTWIDATYYLLYYFFSVWFFAVSLGRGIVMGFIVTRKMSYWHRIRGFLDKYDLYKDLIFLFCFPHSTVNQLILAASIVFPYYMLMTIFNNKYDDVFALGNNYNKRIHKFATLFIKIF